DCSSCLSLVVDDPVPLIGGTAKPSLDEEFLRMHPEKKVGTKNIDGKNFRD
ncbi:hypothetical protein A2U01_0057293, partial [Trifolium medium]|nr:hypothetical protein [Trifolium medium]